MKYLLIIAMVFLSACSPDSHNQPRQVGYVMPKELEGCKVFKVDGDGPYLYITRCEKSTTTQWQQSNGKTKTTISTVVIDGVTYEVKK
jgi:outer membrane biogenesis lipoprotein LolB